MVDNKPGTPADKQILADLFGVCHVYHFGVKSPVETKPKTHFAKKVNSTTTKSVKPGSALKKNIRSEISLS